MIYKWTLQKVAELDDIMAIGCDLILQFHRDSPVEVWWTESRQQRSTRWKLCNQNYYWFDND